MTFSIVTICLNAERYLAEAMDSVLSQDWQDLEYLLVDGGSGDRSGEIIQGFAEQDRRVKYVVEAEPGIARAMNCGLMMAQGDIIAFLHADDRYAGASVLTKVAETFRECPEALWVTGGMKEIDAHGEFLRELPARRFALSRLLRNNIIYHPATFVKRSVMAELGGFDESLRFAMDYDLWLRLSALGHPAQCRDCLADFRVHDGSLSSVERIKTLEEEYLVRQRHTTNSPSRWLHALYQWLRLSLEKERPG